MEETILEKKIETMNKLFKKKSSTNETMQAIKSHKKQSFNKRRPECIRRYYGSQEYACPTCLEMGHENPFDIIKIEKENPLSCYFKCRKCGCEGFHADCNNKPFDDNTARFRTT